MPYQPFGQFPNPQELSRPYKSIRTEMIFEEGAIAHSAGFEPGVRGWIIRHDGTVEFQGGTLGSLTLTGTLTMASGADIELSSGSSIGTAAFPAGGWEITGAGAATFNDLTLSALTVTNDINIDIGDISDPAVQLGSDGEGGANVTGFYKTADTSTGILVLAVGAAPRLNLGTTTAEFVNLEFIILPVKTTAGDPTGAEGGLYLNTHASKNALRIFANGSWQDVVAGL